MLATIVPTVYVNAIEGIQGEGGSIEDLIGRSLVEFQKNKEGQFEVYFSADHDLDKCSSWCLYWWQLVPEEDRRAYEMARRLCGVYYTARAFSNKIFEIAEEYRHPLEVKTHHHSASKELDLKVQGSCWASFISLPHDSKGLLKFNVVSMYTSLYWSTQHTAGMRTLGGFCTWFPHLPVARVVPYQSVEWSRSPDRDGVFRMKSLEQFPEWKLAESRVFLTYLSKFQVDIPAGMIDLLEQDEAWVCYAPSYQTDEKKKATEPASDIEFVHDFETLSDEECHFPQVDEYISFFYIVTQPKLEQIEKEIDNVFQSWRHILSDKSGDCS